MHHNKGKKQTKEHIAKRLKNQSLWKKRAFTEEHKENLRKQMTGNLINLGRKQPPEERLMRSKLCSGEKCHLWKGGVTPINEKIRKSVEYKLWRESVFERDNYTCQHCNERGVILNADHIKPFSLYPDSRFDLDNGRTLCVPCHRKTDTFGEKIRSNITIV